MILDSFFHKLFSNQFSFICRLTSENLQIFHHQCVSVILNIFSQKSVLKRSAVQLSYQRCIILGRKINAKTAITDLTSFFSIFLISAKGGKAFSYQLDVTDRLKVYALKEQVKREVGDVTMLINNAGIVTGKKILDAPDQLMVKTMEVNSISHFWVGISLKMIKLKQRFQKDF